MGNDVRASEIDVEPISRPMDIGDFMYSIDCRMKRMEDQMDRFMKVVPDVLIKMTKEISIIKTGIELLANNHDSTTSTTA